MAESIASSATSAQEVDWRQLSRVVLGFILNRGIAGLTYEEAEDIACETAITVWEKCRAGYRADQSLQDTAQCLAIGVANNKVKQWRDRHFRRNRLLLEGHESVVAQTMRAVVPPDVAMEAVEGHRILWEAIHTLSEDDQVALYMWMRGEAMERIAVVLGLTDNAAKQRVHRSRLKVKEQLLSLLEQEAGATGENAHTLLEMVC